MRIHGVVAVVGCLAIGACKHKEGVTHDAAVAIGPAAATDHGAAARAFIDHLVKREFAAAITTFSPDIARQLDAAKLEKAWDAAIAKGGKATAVTGAQVLAFTGRDLVIVRTALEKGTVDSHVSYKTGGAEIIGFNIDVPVVYTPPPYVDASKVTEQDVLVGTGTHVLPGTLTVPTGRGPFPAVFLVHGSGPGDRDESIGPSRPFRDLALGLASRGIVVLRYEKRTRGYLDPIGVKVEDLTIKEEYFDDVAAAAALLRATPSVDPARVFVVGHSMGGMLTPAFLAADRKLAGGVVFSGNSRAMEDILMEQFTYLARVDDGKIGPLEQSQLDGIAKQIARVKEPALAADTPAKELPLGLPGKYWLSVRGQDPVAVAVPLPQPLLVLQGGRDYQVTEAEDFARWKEGLAKKTNVTFKLYPELNHAGIPGTGMATPTEYLTVEGHVAPAIIDDIAAFVANAK